MRVQELLVVAIDSARRCGTPSPEFVRTGLGYVFMPVIDNRTVWYLPIRESLELAGLLGSRVDVGIGPQTILKHYF